MNCMDLGFHHLLTNVLKMRTSAIENLIVSEHEDMDVMAMALSSLDSRLKAAYTIFFTLFSPGRTKKSSFLIILRYFLFLHCLI